MEVKKEVVSRRRLFTGAVQAGGIGALEKLRHDPDIEVAQAADAALGGVRPPL